MSGVSAPSLDALDLSSDCEINDPAGVPGRDRSSTGHEQDEIPASEWRGEVGQPSERELQQALVEWAEMQPTQASLLHCIPNGQYRPGQRKEAGMRAGVPDLCLPVPGESGGVLYIELKTADNTTTQKQKRMIQKLRDAGNRVEVCRRLDRAIELIKDHISHA